MTRKTLVVVIALIYVVTGFSNFFSSLLSTMLPSGLLVIRVFPLVGGALAFYAGLTMLRLSEFGRKLVILLLSIRVAINAGLLLGLPKDGAGLAVENFLGEITYSMQSPFAYQCLLLILIVVGSLTILFLSQKETKDLFLPAAPIEVKRDIILEE